MSQSLKPVPTRNSLGAAYGAAERLYDNAVAMSLFLDAWSRRSVTPALNASAANHLRDNLMNAQANLGALRQALAEWLDIPPEGCPRCGVSVPPHWNGRACNACGYGYPLSAGDEPCPVNDESDGERVGEKSSMPAGGSPGPRSVRSAISGTGT